MEWLKNKMQAARTSLNDFKHTLKEKGLEASGSQNLVDPHIYQYMDGRWNKAWQCMKCLTIMSAGMSMESSCYKCGQHPNRTLMIEARWTGKKPKLWYCYPGTWETRAWVEPESYIQRQNPQLSKPPLSKEELGKAYRLLLKKSHPDQGGSSEAFRFIQWAFKELGAT